MSTTIIYLAAQHARKAEQEAQPSKVARIARLRVDALTRGRFEGLVNRTRAAGGVVRWSGVQNRLLSEIYTDIEIEGPSNLVDELADL